jgi:hypothetical protein
MKLMPYGSAHFAGVVTKVGEPKSTPSLAPYGLSERADLLAKVGKSKTPEGLAARMPSAEVAAKVGITNEIGAETRRVVRLSARV